MNTMTLADLLSDLRYVAYSSDGRTAARDNDALLGLEWAALAGGRIRVTDAGRDVVRACRDVVLPSEVA